MKPPGASTLTVRFVDKRRRNDGKRMTTRRFGARQGVGMKPNKPDIKNTNKMKREAKIKEGGGGKCNGRGKEKETGCTGGLMYKKTEREIEEQRASIPPPTGWRFSAKRPT